MTSATSIEHRPDRLRRVAGIARAPGRARSTSARMGHLVATVYLNANGNAAPLDDPLTIPINASRVGTRWTPSSCTRPTSSTARRRSARLPSTIPPSMTRRSTIRRSTTRQLTTRRLTTRPSTIRRLTTPRSTTRPSTIRRSTTPRSTTRRSTIPQSTTHPSLRRASSTRTRQPVRTISGQKLTQITWKVALKGNTTTSMTSKVFLAVSDAKLAALKQAIGPGKSQLLVSRRYRTSDRRGAQLRTDSRQQLSGHRERRRSGADEQPRHLRIW